MSPTKRRTAAGLILSLLAACALAAGAEPFLREDWVYSIEPTHLDYFGVNRWGATNFMLPYRGLQRGKRQLESHYADNWRFNSETGGVAGIFLRGASTFVDMALFLGPQNLDHALGHDTRAREISRDYPGSHRYVAKRFTQILPVYFGGRELQSHENVIAGKGGADLNTLGNSTLWEMHNQMAYFAGKKILAEQAVNSAQLENLIFHRLLRMQLSWESVNQTCVPFHGAAGGASPPECRAGSSSARDYANYLMDLNTGRYGVMTADDYRLKMSDLQRATALQVLDPVVLIALYRYGADYLGRGKNQSSIPMIALPGTGIYYLPGLRVGISPFGIEYTQDNYFRWKRTLANIFWTMGDNKYERRVGMGLDIDNIPVWRGVTAGLFGEIHKQPQLSRITDVAPLSQAEVGILHNVYNFGGSLRIPVWTFGDTAAPKQFLLTLKAGRKNTGWIAGEYIKGSAYLETGLGFHL